MKRAKEEAMETLYDGILKEIIKNNLISMRQYKDIITESIIYEGVCNIYKEIKHETRI